MNRSVIVYAAILVLAMGASWVHYTDETVIPTEGTVLVEAKATDLEKIVYHTPDIDVTFEMRTDDFGRYPWVTVIEQKKKKVDGVETVEEKISKFKAGSSADKLITAFTPLMAVRTLDKVDDATLETFGLKEPDTTVTITTQGRTSVLELGGETYGTKDRYVRQRETNKIFVVDDEQFKTLKFAATRLPDRALLAAKPEEIDSFTLQQGASSVQWAQKNKDDRSAAYWERAGGTGKDESFGNWLEKMLKLKSTSFVQEADVPAELESRFDVVVRAGDKPAETLQISQAGEDWYAKSNATRGLVKLTRSSAKDVAEDVNDILEGKTPPPDEKPEPKTDKPGSPTAPPGFPPGMMGGEGPPRPGMPPMPRPKPKPTEGAGHGADDGHGH